MKIVEASEKREAFVDLLFFKQFKTDWFVLIMINFCSKNNLLILNLPVFHYCVMF
jgi:hypothetical protein